MKKTKHIIAGVGFKYLTNKKLTAEKNIFLDERVKVNIGCAVAKKLVENNLDIIILSHSANKLQMIKDSLLKLFPDSYSTIEIKSIDLLSEESVNDFISKLSNDFDYSYIHSAGLSSGSYNFLNPYLALENTPNELPTLEYNAVVRSLLLMTKGLLPLFKQQSKTKVVVINSMSGTRPYPLGFSHSSAKAGLHNAVRSLALELTPKNIFVTEINPGMVDTGNYDSPDVIASVKTISKYFGYNYENLPLMPPNSVAEGVLLAIQSKAHILSLNLVAEGQFPNDGA